MVLPKFQSALKMRCQNDQFYACQISPYQISQTTKKVMESFNVPGTSFYGYWEQFEGWSVRKRIGR